MVPGRIDKIASPRLGDGMVLADLCKSNIRLAEEFLEMEESLST
jgi:hypothetical protein